MAESSWSDEHRLALSVVAGASVVMLAFGFLSIAKAVKSPFAPKGAGQFKTLSEQEAEAREALKVKDTDADTLTDYDEIYIYHTSAYLADSDSDGASDGAEVKGGGNPNCPSGKECGTSAEFVAPPSRITPADLTLGRSDAFADVSSILDPSVLTAFDPVKLRSLLKSAGVPEDQLAKVSDEDLKALYEEALQEKVSTSTARDIQIYTKGLTTSTAGGGE